MRRSLAVIFGLLATYEIGLEPGHTLLFTGIAVLLIGYSHFFMFLRNNQLDNANENEYESSVNLSDKE